MSMWFVPVIPSLHIMRKKYFHKFKLRLGYTERCCTQRIHDIKLILFNIIRNKNQQTFSWIKKKKGSHKITNEREHITTDSTKLKKR